MTEKTIESDEANRPSGNTRTVALLLSDIVGSVALKDRFGTGAYAAALRRHDELFQAAVAAGPAPIGRQDTGDGFLVLYEKVSDATRAALRFQSALDRAEWAECRPQVRCVLHVGEVTEIPDPGAEQPKLI
ncbi:MAG: hypothetical protein R3236_09955, partial [Phycisphaeraceae bacterium]|nr:hypothetical protein [Phycisphaeraceae bacterium]